MSAPDVAVVVPTYNRSARLKPLMEALAAQEGVDNFEVLVVDDNSPDDTQAVLAELARRMPFTLTALRQPANRGPAQARNRGWRTSSAPLICFTDDDCVPSAGWLAAMVESLGEYDLVQGQTEPNPADEHQRGPFSHFVHVDWEMGYYETCNMGYRRDVLERLNGFDEQFSYNYGEDTELGWRARRAGMKIHFDERALVYHEITPSSWRRFLRNVRRRDGIVHVQSRIPGLRKELGKTMFYERTHLPALTHVATSAVLLGNVKSPARWTAWVASGLWYAWEMHYHHPKPRQGKIGWLAVVPGAFIVDLADIAVLARGSLRHRQPLQL